MYFRLNPECYFIRGNKLGAIFDLIDNKIYALNQIETGIVTSVERNSLVSGDEKFLNELKMLRLGNFYNNKMYIEKIRFYSRNAESALESTANLNRAFLEINNSCKRDCWFCGLYGVRRSLGCLGCNKWNEDGKPLEIERWKKLIDELRDLNCQVAIITGGDLTLDWDRTREILYYAEDKFNEIYIVLHQARLSEINMMDLHDRAKPIIQVEDINNETLECIPEGSLPLLIVKPEQWHEVRDITTRSKNAIVDFVIEGSSFTNILPIMSKKEIMVPGLYKFTQNMRYHPCLGNTLAISYTGNVFPCPMMRKYNLGNIKDEKLYTIFEKNGVNKINKFWKLTLDNVDKCSVCEFRYSCGDCRALEESLTGKLDGKILCSYDPKEGIWL